MNMNNIYVNINFVIFDVASALRDRDFPESEAGHWPFMENSVNAGAGEVQRL